MNSNLWHVRLCHYLTKTETHQPVESLEVVVFCLHLSNFVPGILSFTAFLKSWHSSTVILLFFVRRSSHLTLEYFGLYSEVHSQLNDSKLPWSCGWKTTANRDSSIAVCGNQCEAFLLICCVWALPGVLLYDQMSTLVSSVHRKLFQKRFVQIKPKPCCKVSFRKRKEKKKKVFQALRIQLFLNHVVMNVNMVTEAWQPDDVLLCPDT